MSESIEFYRRRLRVSRHQLDDELEMHAELQEQITTAAAAAATTALRAKDELARVEARLSQDFKEFEPSLTVGQLAAKVARARERIEAHKEWMEAREAHEQWEGMREAWKARGFNIRNLSDLYANQYFALNSTTRRRDDGERKYVEHREAMRELIYRRRIIE